VRRFPIRSPLLLGALAALVAVAHADGQANAPANSQANKVHPIPGHALTGMEGRGLILLPLQFVRPGDKLGWVAAMPSPRDFLHVSDSLIGASLVNRAYRQKWVLPAALRRAFERGAGMIPDPDALPEQQLLPYLWKPKNQLTDPLAGVLRDIIVPHDSRYVLAPVELRFASPYDALPGTPPPDTTKGAAPAVQLAVLRLALIDAQGMAVMWAGDVVGDTARTPQAATASLATHLGDLLGAP